MNLHLRNLAMTCMDVINSFSMVNSCKLYGSIANNVEDELSDIDIKVDVSGYDNGKFMLEVPHLLKKELNIIYYDFAPSLIPDSYIVSVAISADNPFAIVDINSVANPHCTTITKNDVKNEIFSHTLKIWVANLKHRARGSECYNDTIRMAKRLGIYTDFKNEDELLEEALIWLEKNTPYEFEEYVNSCRCKFEELIW